MINRWPLRRNYQKISTNRFIVDSPRFWRPEFHPRFKDIFEFNDIKNVVATVNSQMSFGYKDAVIDTLSIYIYEWFSGYRFAQIPQKVPESPQQFLSDLYFTLLDIMGQLTMKDWELIPDDFNLVYHKAETGKKDTSKVDTDEHNNQNANQQTELDILSNGLLRQQSSSSTENVDEETEQNTKQVQDTFLSPQNQGVTPVTTNVKHKGVDGVTMANGSAFTTNTTNANLGDSVKSKSNTTGQGQQAEQALTQNNDARTKHATGSDFGMAQSQENATQKTDDYLESLDFNRSARLQEYYNLGQDRLWHEIISRLSRWILQIDIATGDRNYNECPMYD